MLNVWLKLVISPKQTMLGLIINTNRLTVTITAKYLQEVLNLLNSTWHPNWCCFKVSEAQKPTGKLACFAKGANWVFHLPSHLYLSIAYALSKIRDSCLSHLQSSATLFLQYALGLLILLVRTLPSTPPLPWSMRQNWPIMHLIRTTATKPCIRKSNSFAKSSSLIQASNGKGLLPI